ncbi:M23 family metallopeptidase [Pleurocapsa sp. PCC 7319]|uniref:M23 family metallopeptidase n=1 Tax=Pleurocapsa sp. PCC 7319 TaxID=118161 RepID=UPI00034D7218|nr:M23 family metallopeptidase [Pleurocapsa sp. PCC 7319]
MKVRSILLGLLIAGITPIDLAEAIIPRNQKISSPETSSIVTSSNITDSCKASEESCLDLVVGKTPEIDSDLWLHKIANVLLPSDVGSDCRQRLIFSKPTSSSCVFSWKRWLHLKSENTPSIESLTPVASSHPDNYIQPTTPLSPQPKFPKVSRSNLIVSFPQENSSFLPENTKLTNPAPETRRIASPFGWRRRPYSNQLQFHQGIDYGAPLGSPVVAVGNGIVTKVVSGCLDFGSLACGGQLGNWIEIDHGNGEIATYGHLKYSSITVKEGMKVWKNQAIAQVGSSGWSTGAHLDFRLKVNGKHEDPAKYIAAINHQNTNQIKN